MNQISSIRRFHYKKDLFISYQELEHYEEPFISVNLNRVYYALAYYGQTNKLDEEKYTIIQNIFKEVENNETIPGRCMYWMVPIETARILFKDIPKENLLATPNTFMKVSKEELQRKMPKTLEKSKN